MILERWRVDVAALPESAWGVAEGRRITGRRRTLDERSLQVISFVPSVERVLQYLALWKAGRISPNRHRTQL